MTDAPQSPRPVEARSLAELRAALDPAVAQGRTIGLVPTMGALHEGHVSLVRQSRRECGLTVVSIYVNPSQFGPNEDFRQYPRTLQADLAALQAAGADVAYLPADGEMYPPGFSSWVMPAAVSEPLEGQFRPDHFRGVATVVLKLFNMVRPNVAYFGLKDYQQVRVIEQMVGDLNVPVAVRRCPTIREADGLAMSSRNRYLSPEARARALTLSKALQKARELVKAGQLDAAAVRAAMHEQIAAAADARIDYIALVDPETLRPIERIEGPVQALLAVRIENTRLIDNERIEP